MVNTAREFVIRGLVESVVWEYQHDGGEDVARVRAAATEALRRCLPPEVEKGAYVETI